MLIKIFKVIRLDLANFFQLDQEAWFQIGLCAPNWFTVFIHPQKDFFFIGPNEFQTLAHRLGCLINEV